MWVIAARYGDLGDGSSARWLITLHPQVDQDDAALARQEPSALATVSVMTPLSRRHLVALALFTSVGAACGSRGGTASTSAQLAGAAFHVHRDPG